MKSTIYYFSGTGNSLDIAMKIGAAIEPQAELISIARLFKEVEIQEESDIVGFVFPIYMGDAPWVVKDFVKKTRFLADPYIYAVATCNGNQRNCLPIFRGLIETRLQTLSLGELILMPGNAKISSPKANEERLNRSAKECLAIAQKVNNQAKATILSDDTMKNNKILGSPRKKLNLAFTRFKVSSSCNSCGTCQRICPMCNVELREGKPMWKKQCAACLACFHWCPKKAITFRLPFLGNRPRYHHPNITIKDIAAQQPIKSD